MHRARPTPSDSSTRALLAVTRLEDRTNPAVITVTGLGDAVAADGVVTLREAILSANADAAVNADVIAVGAYGADAIHFGIPGPGPYTIAPTSALPSLTDSAGLTVDGTTQPGFAGTPVVELTGSKLGGPASGLTITSANNTVRGLVINQFGAAGFPFFASGAGVLITGAGAVNNVLRGNFVGTDVTGTAARGNLIGVRLLNGTDTTIGGTDPADRNLISGNRADGIQINGAGNRVLGNFIGTDVTGTVTLGNGDGIWIGSEATHTTVGGTAPGAGNLISGNDGTGVSITAATDTVIQGNRIGTDVTGTTALGNGSGVSVHGPAPNTRIGGPAAGAGNLISGSRSGAGVRIDSANGVVIQGNRIGTDVTGTTALGNSHGIEIRSGSNTVIGGATPGAGNVISGNRNYGVYAGAFSSTISGTVVQGNVIGTNATGTAALGNGQSGLLILGGAKDTVIGGTVSGAGNVISANREYGVFISDAHTTGTIVQGNFVGTDATGTIPLGNGLTGVLVRGANSTVGGTTPGAGNTIAYNGLRGVGVGGTHESTDVLPVGNAILSNRIFRNGSLGIDLGVDGVTRNDPTDADAGPNRFQNAPVLTTVAISGTTATVSGHLTSTPGGTFRLQFFRTPAGGPPQGETLASELLVTTDASGRAAFMVTLTGVNPGEVITATATNTTTNDTSEFGGLPTGIIAVGADAGGGPHVTVFDAATGAPRASFNAYDPSFRGGVRVATADVNGDGTPDVITAAGPGGGPHVMVIDGTRLDRVGADGVISDTAVLRSFYAYDPEFRGGVYVAAGDVSRDGFADVVTGAGPGGGPHVQVFSGWDGSIAVSFLAFAPEFTAGVRVAAADLTGDRYAEVIVGSGPGETPRVSVFGGWSGEELHSFVAFDPTFTGGVFVAAGDVTGDGPAEIVTAAGAGGGPQVSVYDGQDHSLLRSFLAFEPGFSGGVRVAAADVTGDGFADVMAGAGPGGGPHVRVFDGVTWGESLNLLAFAPDMTAGVFVGA